MFRIIFVLSLLFFIGANFCFAYDTDLSAKLYQSHGKQQQKAKDTKGNAILVTPHYESYEERNKNVSEKIVAIYDKKSPAYGYRYVLYTPIGKYVGHHKVMQQGFNGYEPMPEGGEGSSVPCFRTVQEAKHYYYPQWY